LISNHFGDSVSGPEKAGVGGSIPSLATNPFNNLASLKNRVKISRAHNTRISVTSNLTFGVARSNSIHIYRAVLLVLAMCSSGNVLPH
jgi:hypothetical protein